MVMIKPGTKTTNQIVLEFFSDLKWHSQFECRDATGLTKNVVSTALYRLRNYRWFDCTFERIAANALLPDGSVDPHPTPLPAAKGKPCYLYRLVRTPVPGETQPYFGGERPYSRPYPNGSHHTPQEIPVPDDTLYPPLGAQLVVRGLTLTRGGVVVISLSDDDSEHTWKVVDAMVGLKAAREAAPPYRPDDALIGFIEGGPKAESADGA